MKMKWVAVLLCLAMSVALTASADSNEAKNLFDKGKELLSKADFEGAAKTFAEASAKDPDNEDYRGQAQILSRVVSVRKNLKEEADPKRWEAMARALHSYYCTNDLYEEAKKVDQQLYSRLQNEETASMLAETLLELGDNKKAEKTLKPYMSQDPSGYCQLLYGITLVRLNKSDQAHDILHHVKIADDSDAQLRFQGARLNALMGHSEVALNLLTGVFESIPPSRLPQIKEYVSANKDFSSLVGGKKFAAVLQTKSKVSESKCSGGTSCGGCPSASSCSSASGSKTTKQPTKDCPSGHDHSSK